MLLLLPLSAPPLVLKCQQKNCDLSLHCTLVFVHPAVMVGTVMVLVKRVPRLEKRDLMLQNLRFGLWGCRCKSWVHMHGSSAATSWSLFADAGTVRRGSTGCLLGLVGSHRNWVASIRSSSRLCIHLCSKICPVTRSTPRHRYELTTYCKNTRSREGQFRKGSDLQKTCGKSGTGRQCTL